LHWTEAVTPGFPRGHRHRHVAPGRVLQDMLQILQRRGRAFGSRCGAYASRASARREIAEQSQLSAGENVGSSRGGLRIGSLEDLWAFNEESWRGRWPLAEFPRSPLSARDRFYHRRFRGGFGARPRERGGGLLTRDGRNGGRTVANFMRGWIARRGRFCLSAPPSGPAGIELRAARAASCRAAMGQRLDDLRANCTRPPGAN